MSPIKSSNKKKKLIERSDGSWHQETKSENLVRKALETQGLVFQQEHILAGIKVDFFLPTVQIVIEVDGETHLTTENRQRDLGITEKLSRMGYRVIRLSGIEAHSPNVIRGLLQGIKEEEKNLLKITRTPEFNNAQLKEQLSRLIREGKI